ncbi:hypothetical protein OY671_010129, partial [Metschnikowia pulcherrima]
DCRQQEKRQQGGEEGAGTTEAGQRVEPPIPPETGRSDQRSGPSTYVQTNSNHCRAAQDSLWEFVRAEDIAVASVMEPDEFGCTGWHFDSSGRAAVGVLRRGLTLDDVETGDGYVAVTVGGAVRVHSCYASPAMSFDEFESFSSRLEGSVRKYRGAGIDLI